MAKYDNVNGLYPNSKECPFFTESLDSDEAYCKYDGGFWDLYEHDAHQCREHLDDVAEFHRLEQTVKSWDEL